MSSTELLIVASTVLVGAILGHYALLSIAQRLRKNSPNAIALQRVQTLYEYDDTDSSTSSATSNEKQFLRRRQLSPKIGSRGIITTLPNRHSSFSKSPWSQQVRKSVINSLIMTIHDENPRSTYLGADTFNKSNPSAQLFGWERTPGQPTVELGEIALLTKTGGEAGFCVIVHPDDAKTIIDAAWGTPMDLSHRRQYTHTRKGGVALLLKAPESQIELDRATKVVLDAAVWYVAGLDREQTV